MPLEAKRHAEHSVKVAKKAMMALQERDLVDVDMVNMAEVTVVSMVASVGISNCLAI